MTLFQLKEQAALDTPLFLFDATFSDGTVFHWSGYHVTVQGTEYLARVVRTNLFEMQASSEGGVDTIPKLSFDLANADGLMSEIQRNIGFKGASLTVRFVFYDLAQDFETSETLPLFQGLLDSPEAVTESLLRVSAINRLSLQRIALPPIRIQKRCPWHFPATAAQRQEAVDGGAKGRLSPFYNCGYSPDIAGGVGNLSGSAPFTTCDYSRTQCEQRGMFSVDSSNRTTANFGGIEYVPPVITVRASGEKGNHLSPVQDNEARYNDFVPLLYGTGWYLPSIVFARNDGNLTHLEVLLGAGQMTSVTSVLVNGIEIPVGRSGTNMTGTGWYNVISYGSRNGVFNRDFADGAGNPLGDPYGSMAYASIVVPNSINDGRTVPEVKVLANGLQIETFSVDGFSLGFNFSNNPVWVILDILRRSGWNMSEIDLITFSNAAIYCDQPVDTTDLNGNITSTSRFQCNLILKSRRSAGEVIRGIRNASRLYLTYSSSGLLQINVENTIALQQPIKMDSSNATAPLNDGWPVYEFGDGTSGTTGIARTPDGASSLRVTSRGSADTPNRFSIEFQDAFNSYQQDSVALVDPDDVQRCGFEVSAAPNALGVPNYDQAARIVELSLKKSISGNYYIDFQTSVRALGIQPGDIVAVTYLREGLNRTPFRIVRVAPGQQFRTAMIRAQIHDDSWYSGDGGSHLFNSGTQRSYKIGMPRPLIGTVTDSSGGWQFGIVESSSQAQDGTATLLATVAYSAPASIPLSAPGPPLVSLGAAISATGGTLPGNTAFYYALASVDGTAVESALSFAVPAIIGDGPATYAVTLTGISLPASAAYFNVYRGPSPAELYRIASNNSPTSTFTDSGLALEPILPPDASYDHANFYFRMETAGPTAASIFSSTTLGDSAGQMEADTLKGMTVRIISGNGDKQERVIAGNSSTTLTIAPPWTVIPDVTSTYVIAQTGYQFGASANSGVVQFAIPNRTGQTVHISGRSANAYDTEGPYELSTVTRWLIGGAGINSADSSTAPAPVFNLSVIPEGGGVQLGSITFPSLDDVRTVSSGTLTLYYADESSTAPPLTVAADITAAGTALSLSSSPSFTYPQYFAIGQEVIKLTSLAAGGAGYNIERGLHTTTAAAHLAQTAAFQLKLLTVSVPFPAGFFSSGASASSKQSVILANARVCSAQFFVSNSQGNSPVAANAFTTLSGGGLRTLSGGQVTLQIPGALAVQTSAVPPLDPGASYSVKDVYAYVGTPPAGSIALSLQVTVDGVSYCSLNIPVGSKQSDTSVDGATLAALSAGKQIGLNILTVGDQAPGSDLTVVIRV